VAVVALLAPVAALADAGAPTSSMSVTWRADAKCPALARAARSRSHGTRPRRRIVCRISATRTLADLNTGVVDPEQRTVVTKNIDIQRGVPVTDFACIPDERLNLTGTIRDSFVIWTDFDGTMYIKDDHQISASGPGTDPFGNVVAFYKTSERILEQQKFEFIEGGAWARFVHNHRVIRYDDEEESTTLPPPGATGNGDDLYEHAEEKITVDPMGNTDVETTDYYVCA
jgi:hypothetical protein